MVPKAANEPQLFLPLMNQDLSGGILVRPSFFLVREGGESSHSRTMTLQCGGHAAVPSEAVLGYEQQSLNRLYCEEVRLLLLPH